jgi:hypothetical protein
MDNWDIEQIESIPDSIGQNTGLLTHIIDNSLADKDEEARGYIGASSIGNPCERKIWYGLKKIRGESLPVSIRRTFDIGKKLESLILDYLEEAGLLLVRSSQNLAYRSVEVPELQGHADAKWLREFPHNSAIIEIKTAKDSSFRVFQKAGLKKWYPVYYAQVQTYMGMSGTKEAYVLALNKDTSELHDEHIGFDEDYYQELCDKAARIAKARTAPDKINNSPLYFVCRSCQYKSICHG